MKQTGTILHVVRADSVLQVFKFNKKGPGFISFRTNKAFHLFAYHEGSWYFYIHKPRYPGGIKGIRWRTRIGPFEYEYTKFTRFNKHV